MTNGEKLISDFPYMEIKGQDEVFTTIQINTTGIPIIVYTEWLDAEYKEPTAKNNSAHNLCDSCINYRCEFQSGIVRTKCAFYMPPQHSSELEKNSKKLEKDFGELDCISRIETIDYLCKHCPDDGECFKDCDEIQHLRQMPSVTPQEPRWIPMIRREPTDEEKAEYLAQNGEELGYMLENEMPLNGQEVLVSIGKYVSEDVFDEDFYNFENNDIENVDAWMPLPEPYREVGE